MERANIVEESNLQESEKAVETTREERRKQIKKIYKRMMRNILNRKDFTHKQMLEWFNTKGVYNYDLGTISSYVSGKPTELPLGFIQAVRKTELCDDKEYLLLVKLLLAHNETVTLNLPNLRSESDRPMKSLTWLASLICHQYVHIDRLVSPPEPTDEDSIISDLDEEVSKILHVPGEVAI